MSEHRVNLRWERGSSEFTYETYPRDHRWAFDGGATVRVTAAPAYKGNPELVDPEEAFVAALSSCHMLTFLALAAKKKLVVDRYTDDAVGHMAKTPEGRTAITRVELHPSIDFGGDGPPDAATLDALHHKAHELCFIANSVKSDVVVHAPTTARG